MSTSSPAAADRFKPYQRFKAFVDHHPESHSTAARAIEQVIEAAVEEMKKTCVAENLGAGGLLPMKAQLYEDTKAKARAGGDSMTLYQTAEAWGMEYLEKQGAARG